MKELGHQDRHLDFLKVDTDKHDGTGFEDTVRSCRAEYINVDYPRIILIQNNTWFKKFRISLAD